MSTIGNSKETDSRSVVARAEGKGNEEWLLMGAGFLLGEIKMF